MKKKLEIHGPSSTTYNETEIGNIFADNFGKVHLFTGDQ